jgi:transcriptional regulator with XRE-family HTH domain
MMSFAERLQELREDKAISRKELAKILNITISALGMYERGHREPNIEMLIKLADYFNVSLDFLVDRAFNKINIKEILDALKIKNSIEALPNDSKMIVEYILKLNKDNNEKS